MKKLTPFIFLLISNFAIAEDVQSLDNFVIKNSNWKSDNSNIVHVGTRCSGVYDAVIWRMSSDNRPEVQALTEQAKQTGDMYMTITAGLAEEINYSSKGYTELYKYWMDLYKNTAAENHKKYNDIYNGFFKDDFMFCSNPENFQFFINVLEQMAARSKQ